MEHDDNVHPTMLRNGQDVAGFSIMTGNYARKEPGTKALVDQRPLRMAGAACPGLAQPMYDTFRRVIAWRRRTGSRVELVTGQPRLFQPSATVWDRMPDPTSATQSCQHL